MAGVVLDAGVVIGLYNDKDLHHKWAVDFMFQTTSATLHISALNYAEIAVAPLKNNLVKPFFKGIEGLELEISPIKAQDTWQLTQLRAETGLRMTDVCPILVSKKMGLPLATTDKSVAKAALAMGIEVYQP